MSSVLHTSLESTVGAMYEALSRLANQVTDADPSTDLRIIIHNPGWTTPAEAELVEALAISITQHAESLMQGHQALVRGALAVGQAS